MTSNSYVPRLRHAYGELGGLLAGQTYTTFLDTRTAPELLDSGAPAGGSLMRQAQIRYTHALNDTQSLAVSVENPYSDFTTVPSTASTSATGTNVAPDMVAAYTAVESWGHVSARALGREIGTNAATAGQGSSHVWGYGLNVSGKYLVATKSNVFANFSYGDGIGRYIWNAQNLGATYNSATGKLTSNVAYGGYAGAQVFYTDTVRSSFVYGHAHINDASLLVATTPKSTDSVHANLLWSPVPQVDLGVEYIWGQLQTSNKDIGNLNRLQSSVTYRF